MSRMAPTEWLDGMVLELSGIELLRDLDPGFLVWEPPPRTLSGAGSGH